MRHQENFRRSFVEQTGAKREPDRAKPQENDCSITKEKFFVCD